MPRQGFRKMRPELEQRYGDVLTAAGSYNPQQAAETSAKAQFDQFKPELERSIQGLRGSEVGMGRLTTGYGTEDEDRLVTEGIRNLNQQIAGRALDTSRLELEGRGQYGDLITGGIDRARQEEEDERENKKGGWRGFLGGLAGTAAGSFLGPIGAKLGSKLAASI